MHCLGSLPRVPGDPVLAHSPLLRAPKAGILTAKPDMLFKKKQTKNPFSFRIVLDLQESYKDSTDSSYIISLIVNILHYYGTIWHNSETALVHYYELNSILSSESTSFPLTPFFSPRTHPGRHLTFNPCLRLLWAGPVSHAFHDLDDLEEYWSGLL